MLTRCLLPLCLASTLAACSAFTPPKEKPIIEDKVGEQVGTLATTAERRIVLVNLKNGDFCAEPSPDVAEAINSSIRAAAEASAKTNGGVDAKVSGEVARQLATSIGSSFLRTQGIQLFRDGSFALCQARMNNNIKPDDYSQKFDRLLKDSVDLIRLELPYLVQRGDQQASASASASKTAADSAKAAAADAAKSADAAKAAADSAKSQ